MTWFVVVDSAVCGVRESSREHGCGWGVTAMRVGRCGLYGGVLLSEGRCVRGAAWGLVGSVRRTARGELRGNGLEQRSVGGAWLCGRPGAVSCGIMRSTLMRARPIGVVLQKSKTPLHYACERGHVEVVDLLIARGAGMTAREEEVKQSHDSSRACR